MQTEFSPLQESLQRAYQKSISQNGETEINYSLGGQPVCVHFSGQALRSQLLPSLSGNLLSDAPVPADMTIYACENKDFFQIIPGIDRLRKYRDKISVSNQGSAHLLYNPEGDIFSFIDTDTACAYYFVRDAASLPDYEVCTPMRMLLHWICYKRGLLFVHASAVGYAGHGALIIGRGGSGKSTTALLSFLHGLDFISDDYAAVSLDENPRAFPLYRGCKITDAMMPFFPALNQYVIQTNKTQNKNVAVLPNSSGFFPQFIPLSAIVRPYISHSQKTDFSRIPSAGLLMETATSTILQMQGGGDYTLKGLAGLFRQVPTYKMDLSEDFEEIADSIKRFLSQIQ